MTPRDARPQDASVQDEAPAFADFDAPVAAGGYAWWYVDAQSDDLAHGLTIIAFVGSVFSPYYAHARRRGPADPLDHCALNVALYGTAGKRWTMTERGRAALAHSATKLAIGHSALAFDGSTLTIDIDEVAAPWPSRVRGQVRVRTTALTRATFALDAAGAHRWRPLAPCARVEVELASPRLAWAGRGYLDANAGDAPLADAFTGWHWSRIVGPRHTTVLYDVARRDGSTLALARRFDATGGVATTAPPAAATLPATRWRIGRATRCDAGTAPRVVETLEDAPFYARSLIETQVDGERGIAMHESLDLDRFRARWVRALLPFRMPRRRR